MIAAEQDLKIKKLPQTKSKNGCYYELVKRTKHVALYSQQYIINNRIHAKIVGYEVFRISVIPSCEYRGQIIPTYEQFALNEDFGKTAWAWPTLVAANKNFEELVSKYPDESIK